MKNEITDIPTIKYFENFKQFIFLLKLNVALPSTTIKLEIALINVSTVLIVNDKPRIITTNDKILV